MNYLKIFLVLILTNLTSCKENTKTQSDLSSRPEIINVFNSSFNGKPLIMTKNEIYGSFGKPTFEKLNCVTFSNLTANKTEFKYDCLIYDSISKFGFDTYGKIGYLSYVSFNNETIQIKTPQLELNNKTNIEQVKKIFPKSYNMRIEDNESSKILLYFNDDLFKEINEFANIIELGFEEGNLKYFKYQIEPEYITELNKK